MCITLCKIDSKWEFAVRHRELSLVFSDHLEGWDGVGDGGGSEGRDSCIPVADSC